MSQSINQSINQKYDYSADDPLGTNNIYGTWIYYYTFIIYHIMVELAHII
jgi:hypothetical protein